MENNISYCGYDCSKCAARSTDPEVRQKLVDAWRKILGHQMYTADNVYCVGCKNEGKHADTSCQARPCALEKGLNSCAECEEFPCSKVASLVCSRESLLLFCRHRITDATEEEFEMATSPFTCSSDNLLQILKEKGKLPEWVKK